MSAPEAVEPLREVPIGVEDIQAAIRAARDAIDVALDVGDLAEAAEVAGWLRQLLTAKRVFESEDGD